MRTNQFLSYVAAAIIIAWGFPIALLGFAPFGGIDYNPGLSAGRSLLVFVYVGLYRRSER
jgi:hypothetical protein